MNGNVFSNFTPDEPAMIVIYVLCGVVALTCVVLAKVTRVSSFLIYLLFLFSWSLINFVIFSFDKSMVSSMKE